MGMFKNMERLPRPLVWAAATGIRLMTCTLRRSIVDVAGVIPATEAVATGPHIVLVWHNRMLCLPTLSPRKLLPRFVFLASRSRDGGYISDLLAQFGLRAVRGSSSKGGMRAVRELQVAIEEGLSPVITPDGPRGPRYRMHEGMVWLASMTGAPILPVSVNSERHWEMKGWDRFQIPKPFSRVTLEVGAPIVVPPGLDDAGLALWTERVREGMLAITRFDHEPIAMADEEATDASKQ